MKIGKLTPEKIVENVGNFEGLSKEGVLFQSCIGSFESFIEQLAQNYNDSSYDEISYQIVEVLPVKISETLELGLTDFDIDDDCIIVLESMIYNQCKNKYPNIAKSAIRLIDEGY